MLADTIPAEFWGLLSAIVVLASSVVVALVRQLEQTTKALESLQNKMIDQAVPALERSTMAGQAMGPILQQNAAALGESSRASDEARQATSEALRLLAVISDREQRSTAPRRGGGS